MRDERGVGGWLFEEVGGGSGRSAESVNPVGHCTTTTCTYTREAVLPTPPATQESSQEKHHNFIPKPR